MHETSKLSLSNLSLTYANNELLRELKIIETAFKVMKNNKKIKWKDINPSNGSKLIEHSFFDHLCNKEHEKELKKLYFRKINKNEKIPLTQKGKALTHDLIFSLVFLKELERSEKIVLEPKYIFLEDKKLESSPDMIVENSSKYSIEIKVSKKGAIKRAPKQIKNSFIYDSCNFGICAFPEKKITKIGRINNNLHFLCFLPEENYSELECLGLEKTKERNGVVQINYIDIKEFLNENVSKKI